MSHRLSDQALSRGFTWNIRMRSHAGLSAARLTPLMVFMLLPFLVSITWLVFQSQSPKPSIHVDSPSQPVEHMAPVAHAIDSFTVSY